MIFLHFLRHLAKANPQIHFIHFGHAHVLEECSAVVEDIPNIDLFSFDGEQWPALRDDSICVWKNFEGHWEKSAKRWDWSAHTLEHHAWTAARMGLESPFNHREQLLLDYPSLNPNNIGGSYFYEALFVNSEPCSGQFKPMAAHGSGYFDEIIKSVARKFSVITTQPVFGVECTRDSKKSLTDIGRISLLCRHHFMVSTGPSWPTINTSNHHHGSGRVRVVLMDGGENLNMPGIEQCSSRETLIPWIRKAGLL